MKVRSLMYLCCLAILSSNAFAVEIKVSGGAAPMNNIYKKIKDAFEKHSGHRLVLNEQSPELALQALEKGEIQVASAGLRWEDWLKLCEEKAIKIDASKPFKFSEIGKDSINFFVNKASSVKKLSGDQVDSIFTGKISNWKEVGGPDKKINVVFGKSIAGTNKFVRKMLLSADFKSDVVTVGSAEDIAVAIGKDPDAIGFGPAGIDVEKFGITIADTPESFRPIVFVYLRSDKKEITDLKDFILSPAGQSLIKK